MGVRLEILYDGTGSDFTLAMIGDSGIMWAKGLTVPLNTKSMPATMRHVWLAMKGLAEEENQKVSQKGGCHVY